MSTFCLKSIQININRHQTYFFFGFSGKVLSIRSARRTASLLQANKNTRQVTRPMCMKRGMHMKKWLPKPSSLICSSMSQLMVRKIWIQGGTWSQELQDNKHIVNTKECPLTNFFPPWKAIEATYVPRCLSAKILIGGRCTKWRHNIKIEYLCKTIPEFVEYHTPSRLIMQKMEYEIPGHSSAEHTESP